MSDNRVMMLMVKPKKKNRANSTGAIAFAPQPNASTPGLLPRELPTPSSKRRRTRSRCDGGRYEGEKSKASLPAVVPAAKQPVKDERPNDEHFTRQ